MYHGPKLARPEDVRLALGKADQCGYCQRAVGQGHGPDCVIPQRTVVLKYTVTLVQSVPADWGSHDIEFHRNDGSWCGSNFVTDLEHQLREDHCLCNQLSVEFVSEATPEMEDEMGWIAREEEEEDKHQVDRVNRQALLDILEKRLPGLKTALEALEAGDEGEM